MNIALRKRNFHPRTAKSSVNGVIQPAPELEMAVRLMLRTFRPTNNPITQSPYWVSEATAY